MDPSTFLAQIALCLHFPMIRTDFVCQCKCNRGTPHRQGCSRDDGRTYDRCPCTLCGTAEGGHGCHVLTPRRQNHAGRPRLCFVCWEQCSWHDSVMGFHASTARHKGKKRKWEEMPASSTEVLDICTPTRDSQPVFWDALPTQT